VILLTVFLSSSGLRAERPWGATYKDQSAYALGSFVLSVIFVESNGEIDADTETWRPGQLDNLHTEIGQAAAFWEGLTASYHPNARLDITVDYVNGGVPLDTGYEPITRAGVNSSGLWMNEVMFTLGYTSSNRFTNARDFNNDQRDLHATHWSSTLYVVNDENDTNNKFPDGYFAYGYHGGPFSVTTYGNDGWGIGRYDRVLSHELGHVFFALDEYYASKKRNNERGGYLNGINGNAERDAAGNKVTPRQPNALMINNTLDLSEFTSVQVGHLDSDGDSIPDILDTFPLVNGNIYDSDAEAGLFAFSGTAVLSMVDNQNPESRADSGNDITINSLVSGWYNLDSQGWVDFSPTDGAWDGYLEIIELELSGLAPGLHTIDLRVFNSVGNSSDIRSFELDVVPEPASAALLLMGLTVLLLKKGPE